ncbi:glutamate-ammonia-ligase adenylyltransferase [Allocatelliglobosispora scoriae]|uniref:Glutamate-ammonia-ligase adenylyltransferase n=1 Tax=Allocatelliglobosispora scoriae TaxID=643052 RepID=A0A841BMN2_9ACTN|nr:glutamate-ammonia-ligase adenylyltransferase [Allocatelliglobosispora scoriae]
MISRREAFALGAADPELAARQMDRLVESALRAGVELDLSENPLLRQRLVAVLGASSTLGDHLVANPAEITALVGSPVTELPTTSVAHLRLAYLHEILRIAADDLAGGVDVERTMTALTRLADATLRAGFEIAAARVGRRPKLAVIAMGKCGGGELNYVSDVDVIFVAEEDADLGAATTVAAGMMEICGQVAWPVDANLRPEGSQGPLVRTMASHRAYYHRWAKTWEFQALLKARPAAGDIELGERWLADLEPLIWTAAERPEAVDEIRHMRRRIIAQVAAGERDREIKRGPGGLRDIEFAVQLLQLVHGRGDTTLRHTGTLPALHALVTGGYIGRRDGEALALGYRFLRQVEHRLQVQRLRRTHTVPTEPTALRWLAHGLGYRAGGTRDAVEAFRADWVAHAAEVRRLHAKLFYRPLLDAVAKVPSGDLTLSADAAKDRLTTLGYADPVGALRHIEALTGGVSRTASIQRTLLPVMLDEWADDPDPDAGLLAYRRVSEKLGTTPWYLRLLRDEGPVALRLARLLGTSRYVTDLLERDPEALRLLAQDAELLPRPRQALIDAMVHAAARHTQPEQAIRAVRGLRRRELFRIACADLLSAAGEIALDPKVTLDGVGQALSDVTDATLTAGLAVARLAADAPEDLRFTIIGMGRLGGYEVSYPSDADVMFVYDPPPGMPEDTAQGHALAIAEHLRRLLSLPSSDPPLGIDADLRPEGRQGPLVRSISSHRRYYATWSHTWEAQALLRARPVAGSVSLGEEFLELVAELRYPPKGLTREQIIEIRRIKARVETERLPRGADPLTHTKLGRGGIADVEWTVQLLQLRHGHRVPGLRTTRTLTALAAAQDAGLVSPMDAAVLAAAWQLAGRVRNALTLIRGRAGDQLPRHGPELAGIARVLAAGDPGEFLDDYLRGTRRARAVVERIFMG